MHGWLRTRGSPRARAPSWTQSLAAEGVGSRQFLSRYAEPGAALAADLWDLDGLAAAYREFLCGAQELTAGLEEDLTPERVSPSVACWSTSGASSCSVTPGCPSEVLPADWPGRRAAVSFDTMAASLLPLARTFVDSCLSPDPQTRS